MNWQSSAFGDDRVTLSWWDLLVLAFGGERRFGPCVVRRGGLR